MKRTMTTLPCRHIHGRCRQALTQKSVLPLLLMALLLSACATTSEPLQFRPVNAGAAPISDEATDQENKLTNLSHDELITRGNQYLNAGNTSLARLHFSMAFKKDNNSAPAYAGLGEILALNGENQAAHRLFVKALALDEELRQALLTTGKLYRIERNHEQAIVFFNRALETYTNDPEILTELAITYSRAGDEGKAEQLFTQVVDKKPQDPAAHNNLGFSYIMQKKYPAAIATLHKALALTPNDRQTLNNLATAYALNDQTQKALNMFRKTEGEAAAYNDLGYLHMIQGNTDTARSAFEKAMELHPRHYVRAKENLDQLQNEQ